MAGQPRRVPPQQDPVRAELSLRRGGQSLRQGVLGHRPGQCGGRRHRGRGTRERQPAVWHPRGGQRAEQHPGTREAAGHRALDGGGHGRTGGQEPQREAGQRRRGRPGGTAGGARRQRQQRGRGTGVTERRVEPGAGGGVGNTQRQPEPRQGAHGGRGHRQHGTGDPARGVPGGDREDREQHPLGSCVPPGRREQRPPGAGAEDRHPPRVRAAAPLADGRPPGRPARRPCPVLRGAHASPPPCRARPDAPGRYPAPWRRPDTAGVPRPGLGHTVTGGGRFVYELCRNGPAEVTAGVGGAVGAAGPNCRPAGHAP